jgi:hypothetical protein
MAGTPVAQGLLTERDLDFRVSLIPTLLFWERGKNVFKNLAALCLPTMLFQAAAFAGDGYPMSGQDGVFRTDRGPLVLKDKDGQEITLEDGMAFRMRFSIKSSSFHIMKGNGHRQEFKVQGNFPGKRLDQYTLEGAKWGNPGITLVANEPTEVKGSGQRTEYESCSFACGQDNVCRQVFAGNTCDTRTVCEPSQVCKTVGGVTSCETVTRCRNVEVNCRPYYRTDCGYETRYCSGTREVLVETTSYAKYFDLKFIDESSKAETANFRSLIDAWNNRDVLRTSGCR